jgi:glycosyltransferase involved in cell wall biosynthesis
MSEPIEVVHVNASDDLGGAARSCVRLHRALEAAGAHSQLILEPPYVPDVEWLRRVDSIERQYVRNNRTESSNTHFSLTLSGRDLSADERIREADVIHLHWVATAQTPASLRKLLDTEKPVVWTLHDEGPFTGGCHYTAGCTGFRHACEACVQLRKDPLLVPSVVLRDKAQLLAESQLTLVAPSVWLAEQARTSAVFGGSRIEVIPNGVDTDMFRVRSRREARGRLGLDPDAVYVLCGANHEERRKGVASLDAALARVVHDPRLAARDVRVLWAGHEPSNGLFKGLAVTNLGRLETEDEMAQAYAAADVFVLPSLEDNLPNMLLEAMACGTPVIAYAVGGVVDVVEDGVDGRLAEVGDDHALAEGIADLIADPAAVRQLGERAATKIADRFSARHQAFRMLDLYGELREAFATTERAAPSVRAFPEPGPALAAILGDLTAHCLARDLDDVIAAHATASGAADEESARQIELIEHLEAQWRLSEKESAKRLELIERLDKSLRRRTIRGVAGGVRRAIRFDNWWYAKIPPLLAVAYLQVLLAHVRLGTLVTLLPCALFSIASVAAYGHVVNDAFDVGPDRRVGKQNAMAHHSVRTRAVIAGVLAVSAFSPALVASYGWPSLALLAVNLLLPTVYSMPRIRVKERGTLALLCDAAGSHLAPTLFLLTVLAPGIAAGGRESAFAAIAVTWAAALGLKGIVHHQLCDRRNDLASATATWATERDPARLQWWLARYNLAVELPLSLALAIVVWPACPLAAAALALYVGVESLKYLLGFRFSLNADPLTIRASIPFTDEGYYVLWLPLAAATQLAVVHPALAWLPLVQAAAFARPLRAQIADLRVVMAAGRGQARAWVAARAH